ncbi:hypothetical protein FJ973_29610 [Mesorhizobium sp. B2-1-3]|uniref:hypothetical protein n=1 Tax=Mesorhizobium sp. B2-1-3 TaxID=2589972 RepID=UPI00112BF3A0|nr:hypothetical protein [Mesorhizobium sp. B2-1-3]TPN03802.1 hypothetical protein FJ973_29610 [Mesorhizobium sp. B2-1-3]
MTLGASPSPAQVVAELGQTSPYTFPDARSRWLADVGSSDPITFPTSFANKTALKIPATTGASGVSTSHSFAGVNFGPVFTNRRLLCYVIAHGKSAGVETPADVTVTNFTVGGVPPVGGVAPLFFWYYAGTTDSAVFSGVQSDSFNPSGTSGTISFTTNIALNCSVIVFSMIGSNDIESGSSNGNFSEFSPISDTLNVQNDATLITVGVQNSSATLTVSGCTKRSQFSPVAGYQCVVGYDNHQAAQTGRAISISGSSGAATAMITDGWNW